ncbi:MAG TPA: type II secretion system protein [Armatimonadota bacterium]|nr:type II secretion system protein [Armatimonadota bacterium]
MLIRRRDGYTLMELLTVIAIIAVLAGLIFPVAAGAKRKARQAQCINNMYQIFTAIKQFQLDEHRYPDFIAGPVQWNTGSEPAPKIVYSPGGNLVKLEDNTGMMGGTTGGNGRLVALYPEYIPNFGPLKCPFSDLNAEHRQYTTGNPAVGPSEATSDIEADPMFAVLNGTTDDMRAKGVNDNPFWVYKYSSYDYQKPPGYLPTDLGQIHYSTVWKAGNDPVANPNITRQLKWRTPPEDTVITWCSHHRSNGSTDGAGRSVPLSSSKDIVLFLDGHVKQDASLDMEPWATKGWLAAP